MEICWACESLSKAANHKKVGSLLALNCCDFYQEKSLFLQHFKSNNFAYKAFKYSVY